MSPLPPTRDRPVTGTDASRASVFHGGEPPRRRRWVKRLGVIVIVILAIVLGAAAALTFVAKQQIDDFVTPKTAAGRAAQKQLAKPVAGKPTNILVLGSDNREAGAAAGSNSDTLLLVRLDPEKNTISMMSFPRDLYVPIPGHGSDKINSAYANGGPALTVQTIKQLTGLDVNFVMDVDFNGFRAIVEQLGGIYVDVDRKYFVAEGSGHSAIDLEPGYQRLRGADALAFARHRISDSDFHRIARQQLVLASLKKQLAASPLRKNIRGLLQILKQNTEVVAGGGDTVPTRVLIDFIKLGLGLDGKAIYQVEYQGTTGFAGEASIVEYSKPTMDAAVAAFLSPNSSAREQTADSLVGKQAPSATAPDKSAEAKAAAEAAAAPAPSTVSVKVLNGSGVAGSASTMAGLLRSAGYDVEPTQTNADNQNYANTRVQYRDKADKAAAEALAQRIDGATAEQAGTSNTFDTKLLVIVGRTGTSVNGEGTASGPVGTDGGPTGGPEYDGNVVPVKAAAKVVTDREYGRDDFLDLATASKRLPFPILYPTVRATGSTFEGVNRYSVAKGHGYYQAYRLVAKTATGDYYGLQATNWPDPPILDSPTREVTRGGRTYQLFFNGTKLHLIAWHQGAGTYWVANSILDKLSNETMLAIATGVKPYR